MSKNGKLLVLCCGDGVLSKNEYLCQISCKWLYGNDDQAEMAKVRDQSFPWALTAESPITFTIPKKKAAGWDVKLTTLKDDSNIMNADKKRHRVHFCTLLHEPRQRIVVQLFKCSFADAHSIDSCLIRMYV